MTGLNATITASLADDVYTLTKLDTLKRAITFLDNKYGDVLTFSEDNMLSAKTGGLSIIKVKTAFGFVLLGKGKLKGHAFFLFRGTQYLADWLTNLNLTVSRSSSGQPVHDGFNASFKSMEPQLINFMSTIHSKGVHTIHCVGHSLGGALATLCGDWLSSAYKIKPYIYTFGSPRVGLHGFSKYCTANVGSDQIFRAYHKTDIVPCIPIWPYIHTPFSGRDYYLPSPGIVPMAEYHGMDHYINSVRGKSWDQLAGLRAEKKNDKGIARWLEKDTPIGLTITSIEWLNDALIYVLKKCLNGAEWLISQSFSTSLTLMDQLAYIIKKGIDLSKNISSWVMHLMRKIMRLLGMNKILDTADLTHTFIRNIFLKLQFKINCYTQSVLSKILVNGRAI